MTTATKTTDAKRNGKKAKADKPKRKRRARNSAKPVPIEASKPKQGSAAKTLAKLRAEALSAQANGKCDEWLSRKSFADAKFSKDMKASERAETLLTMGFVSVPKALAESQAILESAEQTDARAYVKAAIDWVSFETVNQGAENYVSQYGLSLRDIVTAMRVKVCGKRHGWRDGQTKQERATVLSRIRTELSRFRGIATIAAACARENIDVADVPSRAYVTALSTKSDSEKFSVKHVIKSVRAAIDNGSSYRSWVEQYYPKKDTADTDTRALSYQERTALQAFRALTCAEYKETDTGKEHARERFALLAFVADKLCEAVEILARDDSKVDALSDDHIPAKFITEATAAMERVLALACEPKAKASK